MGTHLRCTTSLLLMGIATGCAGDPAAEPDEAVLPVQVEAAPVAQPEPQFRWLDAAADQSLTEEFGFSWDTRDPAREKYASQRWRFRGTAGGMDGPNRFAIVHIEGMRDVNLFLRNDDETAKVQPQQSYLFEATVEDWLSRKLIDGIVIPEGM